MFYFGAVFGLLVMFLPVLFTIIHGITFITTISDKKDISLYTKTFIGLYLFSSVSVLFYMSSLVLHYSILMDNHTTLWGLFSDKIVPDLGIHFFLYLILFSLISIVISAFFDIKRKGGEKLTLEK